MTTELLARESKIILAREGTYGTDEIDLANNLAVARRYEAFTEIGVAFNGDFRERNIVRPSFSNNRGQYSRRNATWTIDGIVPVPATAGNAPLGLDHMLVAAGCKETLVADTTATYAMSTPATAGLTGYLWKRHADTYVWRFTYGTGLRGNVSLSGNIRDWVTYQATLESNNFPFAPTATNELRGWSKPMAYFDADGTILLDKTGASITYTGVETMDDPRGLLLNVDSVITIDSVAFPISAFTLDFGNNVKVKDATSSNANGTAGTHRTGRNVNGNYTLAEGGPAFTKALALLHADSEVSCTIVMKDGLGSGGTTLTITMGDLQLRSVDGPEDAEGLAAFTLPFQANANWTGDQRGDNELTLVWSVTA